jgi:enoyl-CoA hydratase/carnithine racemase
MSPMSPGPPAPAPPPSDPLVVAQEGAVTVVRLARPGRANALDTATVRALRAVVDDVAQDTSVRVLLLEAEGTHFCAGVDLKEVGRPAGWFEAIRDLFDAVAALPIPTVAALKGGCLGGGAELALSCDLRIGDTTARIGFPEIRIGALPVAGGTQRLTRAVGRADAAYLLWTGEPVDAGGAHRLGLLQEVVAPDVLVDRVRALCGQLASRSPLAVAMAKRLVDVAVRTDLETGLQVELEESVALFADLESRVEQARATDPLYARVVGEEHARTSISGTDVCSSS